MRMVFALAVAVLATVVPVRAADAPDVRVVSFNIRYGTAKDGRTQSDHFAVFAVLGR